MHPPEVDDNTQGHLTLSFQRTSVDDGLLDTLVFGVGVIANKAF